MDLDAALAKAKEAEDKAAQLQTELEAIKQNNLALVDEKRRETEQKQAFAEEAKKNAQELAKKNGDYESVLKSAEEEKLKALESLNKLQSDIATEKLNSLSLQIATELAFDGDSAWLLQGHIMKRLKFSDNGVKVTNENGDLTVSSIEDLKKEFAENSKFKVLLKGTSASGGRPISAPGRPGNPIDPNAKLSAVQRMHLAHEAKKQ